jgi:hypothetical protein
MVKNENGELVPASSLPKKKKLDPKERDAKKLLQLVSSLRGGKSRLGDELINSDDEGKSLCLNNVSLEEETEQHFTAAGHLSDPHFKPPKH